MAKSNVTVSDLTKYYERATGVWTKRFSQLMGPSAQPLQPKGQYVPGGDFVAKAPPAIPYKTKVDIDAI
jgi:hypothetical protein